MASDDFLRRLHEARTERRTFTVNTRAPRRAPTDPEPERRTTVLPDPDRGPDLMRALVERKRDRRERLDRLNLDLVDGQDPDSALRRLSRG